MQVRSIVLIVSGFLIGGALAVLVPPSPPVRVACIVAGFVVLAIRIAYGLRL